MSCEYCNGSDEQKSIGSGEQYGISIYLNYYADDGWYIAAMSNARLFGKNYCALEEEQINYCPMCGRDLRGDNHD